MSRHFARVLGAVLALYLVAPLALFLVRVARTPSRGFHVPGLVPALLLSVSCATASLALIVLFGVPLAYALARSRGWFARLVEVAVTLPLALPPVMGGIVMVYVIGPYTTLGQLFHRQLTESVYGIVIAMTFTSAPFLVLSARAAFSLIDPSLLDVASTLGHGEMSRFFTVAVPLAGPSIRAGMTMTWLRAFGEYGAVTILAYNPASLPIYTVNEFMARGLNPTLAPTLLALGVAALVVYVGRARLHWPRRHHGGEVTSALPPLIRSARPSFDVATHLGDFHLALRHAARQDTLAVLGPSGSGKSLLLRALVGLHGSEVGRVCFGDDDVSSRTPERRSVGYVAQGFSLFPHLSVWGNVMFPSNARAEYARYWLDRLGVGGLEDRLPSQLSGGQRQRVALAQALSRSPEVLLLDEPFSALDVPIRRELQRELRQLQRDTGVAFIIVTHDPLEAATLASEIIVLGEGRVLQAGPTAQVFQRPASSRVARLLDRANVLEARTTETGLVDSTGATLSLPRLALRAGERVLWSVRPERLRATSLGDPEVANDDHVVTTGTVVDVMTTGVDTLLEVRLSPEWILTLRHDGASPFAPGDECRLHVDLADVDVWRAEA